ncbi:DUF1761 domain-containing protein [Oricola sp.]|uniref:DUF1761 domain-containing protein n=1 Tax=Oricola sp. TaxID=1979950 RepID=UPI003BAA207C
MQEVAANVSWLATVIGAGVAFVTGWFWFSPNLFGKAWSGGHDVSKDGNPMRAAAKASQVAGLLLVSWFTGIMVAHDQLFAFVLAVAGYSVLKGSSSLFANKSGTVIAIDFSYWVLAAVIMVLAHTLL